MNYELRCDTVASIPIMTTDKELAIVPAKGSYVAATTLPDRLQAAVVADGLGYSLLVLTPLVEECENILVRVYHADKLAKKGRAESVAFSIMVDVVKAISPDNVVLDLCDAQLMVGHYPATE